MIVEHPMSNTLSLRPAGRSPDRAIVAGLDAGAAVVSGLLITLTSLDATGGPRTLLALVFVTFVPGWALLDHVAMTAGGIPRIALAVGLSLTITVLTTFALLRLHLWYPVALLDVLGGLSLVGVLLHLLRPDRSAVTRAGRLTVASESAAR
jgi:uncharacterized membrane protein